ncbi:Zinc finger 62 like [Brachionus plicatilis]|uniref:Zinc finger 62 like n=1 Tax=Brachionus plicatilis TaxID=10195 RepID=A0A3M7S530_BRAPC|nr:Zinc finger 62 like [Brachionus plicatilis]
MYKYRINPSSGDIKIDQVAHGFACDLNDRCLRIKEFFIPANYSNNCYEKNIPIQFGNSPQTGYYPPDGDLIETIQINYDHCRKIKKFLINSKKILIIVGENIALSPINDIDDTVGWLLIKNFDLIDFVLHKFNWLDENKNKMKFMMASKDAVFYCFCTKLLICFLILIEQNKKIELEEKKKKKDNDGFLSKNQNCSFIASFLFCVPKKKFKGSKSFFEKSIFEKFKDISTLDEKHCKEITGWSKEKFISFSKYIKSVNDNLQRSKEQLIALYRYWLSTGSNQKTLASLFKEDVLAIVCDGTYTRLEKTSDNDAAFIEERTDQTFSKSKQLTTEQTSDTKLVTKCRFIVEKQIGILKNKKALDNIRNSEAGHIMIDYRNCCAVINFDFKPSCSDGVNAGKIAKRILKKIEKKQNNLEFLLGKQLDTKEIVPINFSEIDDFPVLKRKTMQNKIFLGSFQLRQAKSYISDLALNPTAFIVKNDLIAYICSCLSGRKVAGCCSHVAALIYYFAYAKHKEIFSPAEGLNNILIKIDSKTPPNDPIYYRNKRRKLHVSSSSDSSCSSDESDENRFEIEKSKEIGQYVTNKYNLDKKQNSDSMKFICKIKKSKNDQKTENESGSFVLLGIKLKDFENHVPKWSAIIEYHGLKDVYVKDTCTIDYHLLALWYFSIIKPNGMMNLDSVHINNLNWDKAREVWINCIIEYKERPFKRDMIYQLSLYGKNEMIKLYSCYSEKCAQCRLSIIPEIRFIKKPTYVYIQSINNNIYVEELPKIITIENCKYRFLYSTVHKPGHFLGIFEINNNLYSVDDITRNK